MENEANVGLCLSERHEKHYVFGERWRAESLCPLRLFFLFLSGKQRQPLSS